MKTVYDKIFGLLGGKHSQSIAVLILAVGLGYALFSITSQLLADNKACHDNMVKMNETLDDLYNTLNYKKITTDFLKN